MQVLTDVLMACVYHVVRRAAGSSVTCEDRFACARTCMIRLICVVQSRVWMCKPFQQLWWAHCCLFCSKPNRQPNRQPISLPRPLLQGSWATVQPIEVTDKYSNVQVVVILALSPACAKNGESPGTHCLCMHLIPPRCGDSGLFLDSSVSCEVRVRTW